MLSGLIEAARQSTVDSLANIVVQDQERLVSYSQNYLSQINAIMAQLDTDNILMQQKTRTQLAINQLYEQVNQIQDFQNLDLLNLSQKSLKEFKKSQGNIDVAQKQIYKEAIKRAKQMRQAIKNLNNASNAILNNYYKNNEKDKVDQYLQQGMALSERYQSLVLKELNQNYSAETVFQIEGQVFMIVNVDIASKHLITSDIGASSKGGKIKGRFNIQKSLLKVEEETLRDQYGLMRLDDLVKSNSTAKQIMDIFLSAKKGESPVTGTLENFGQYTISRGDNGKYIADWTYEGTQYQGIIGNEGDLSEIYLAALFNQTDLKGNALGKFIQATKVDNISGALVGDFRRQIGSQIFEFSAKSNKASYTLIDQMQTMAYQIIGLNAAGVGNIKEIISAEYTKSANASSQGDGRNIVIDVAKQKIINLLNS